MAPVLTLASPEGGEGRGEELLIFPIRLPSPQPSPRLDGERERGAVSSRSTTFLPGQTVVDGMVSTGNVPILKNGIQRVVLTKNNQSEPWRSPRLGG